MTREKVREGEDDHCAHGRNALRPGSVLRLDRDCEEKEDDKEAGDDLWSEHEGYDIRPPILSSLLFVLCWWRGWRWEREKMTTATMEKTTTATSNLVLVIVRFLLMTREKVREGEDDQWSSICNQHQLQFNTNYNLIEEILLTHTFNRRNNLSCKHVSSMNFVVKSYNKV